MIIWVDHKETQASYLAGVFDGEGSVCLNRAAHARLPYCQTSIAQNNVPFLETLKDRFGGSVIKSRARTNGWNWAWQLRDATKQVTFLTGISPYVVIKHEEVMLAIELCKAIASGNRGLDVSEQEELVRLILASRLEEAAERRKQSFWKEPIDVQAEAC